MPGPVSDSYDPEFGTGRNAEYVREGIQEVLQIIKNRLGDELKPIVEVAIDENSVYNNYHKVTLSERELRLIRFSINRVLESI